MREKVSWLNDMFGVILAKWSSQVQAKCRSINDMVKSKMKKKSVRKSLRSINYHVVTGLIKDSNAVRY